LHKLGYSYAAIIGRVEPRTTEAAPIRVNLKPKAVWG